MSGRVGLGIVGYGRQGSMYADIIAYGDVCRYHRLWTGAGMLLTAVTNVHRERREAGLRANPDNEVFDDHVYARQRHRGRGRRLRAPYDHPQMGIEALNRNVHALIEKPAGVFTKQVRDLAAFVASRPDLSFGINGQPAQQPALRADQRDCRRR